MVGLTNDKGNLKVVLEEEGTGLALDVEGGVAHDAADAGKPIKVGGRARATQIGAVANDDRTDAVFNQYGEQVLAGHNWTSQSQRTEEVDPIDQKNAGETLCALTNIAQNTTDYVYVDMDGYTKIAFQIETSGAAPVDVLTVTCEASCQDDGTAPGSCVYQDVTMDLFGVASVVDANDMWMSDTCAPFKYIRIKYVTSAGGGNDADLTIYSKRLY